MMTNENKGAPIGAPAVSSEPTATAPSFVGRGLAPAATNPTNPTAPPVLYEDAAIIVTVKPAGILSAPAEGKREKALSELLSPDAPLYVVHRLDRPTAGVMVYAKTARAAAHLSTKGEMEKTYLAVCEGVPAEREATLCDLLFFDRAKDKSFTVKKPRRGVKEARLAYEVVSTLSPDTVGGGAHVATPPASDATCLVGPANQVKVPPLTSDVVGRGLAPAAPLAERVCDDVATPPASDATRLVGPANQANQSLPCVRGGVTAGDGGVVSFAAPQLPLTLLRVTLDTGRTHQIRAQFASRRLPLCGDRRYGAKTGGNLGLFATRLSFVHPNGKRMTFEVPMPDTAPFSLFIQ